MITLAMDTAGKACSACVYDAGRDAVLSEKVEYLERGHAERLMGTITAALAEADVKYDDLTRIITTVGPGSFTGIRVAIATARGFALGLNIAVVGVSNLEAMLAGCLTPAERGSNAPAGVVEKAGREGCYCQFNFNTSFSKADTPVLLGCEDLLTILRDQKPGLILCGDGIPMLDISEIKGFDVRDTSGVTPIAAVAQIGASSSIDDSKPVPLYLREPDAKPQTGFAVERLS